MSVSRVGLLVRLYSITVDPVYTTNWIIYSPSPIRKVNPALYLSPHVLKSTYRLQYRDCRGKKGGVAEARVPLSLACYWWATCGVHYPP